MKDYVIELIAEVESEIKLPSANPYLPDIHELLVRIQKGLNDDNRDYEFLGELAKGLGRLVTEEYEFSFGPLGSSLLEFASDIMRNNPPKLIDR